MPKRKPTGIYVAQYLEGNGNRPPTQRPISHRQTVSEAVRAIGEVIYGVRTFDGLVKVGFTANFQNRMNSYGLNRRNMTERLLFLVPGRLEDEQAIHSWLQPYVARGREYYHPAPEVFEFINEMRANWELPPIAA